MLDTYPSNLKSLNYFVNSKWPGLKVIRGSGYYYISSDDEKLLNQLSGLYTTSLDGMWPKPSDFTYRSWQRAIQDVLNDSDRIGSDRDPIVFESKLSKIYRSILKLK